MDNENRFKQAMAALASIYQNTLQAEQVAMYWKVLGKFNPDHLDEAITLHVSDPADGKWFPKPAHLIGHIKIMQDQDKRNTAYIAQQNQLPHKPPSEEDKARFSAILKELKR